LVRTIFSNFSTVIVSFFLAFLWPYIHISTSQHRHFSPEDGDSMFLRNVGIHLWVYMASQPRRTTLSSVYLVWTSKSMAGIHAVSLLYKPGMLICQHIVLFCVQTLWSTAAPYGLWRFAFVCVNVVSPGGHIAATSWLRVNDTMVTVLLRRVSVMVFQNQAYNLHVSILRSDTEIIRK
jgi:hypothetical protein